MWRSQNKNFQAQLQAFSLAEQISNLTDLLVLKFLFRLFK